MIKTKAVLLSTPLLFLLLDAAVGCAISYSRGRGPGYVNGSIAYCNVGTSSCYGATIDGCDRIICEGTVACALCTITNSKKVECSQNSACALATLDAGDAADGATLSCTSGVGACACSTIKNFPNVVCEGDSACLSTTFEEVGCVTCNGFNDLSESIIATEPYSCSSFRTAPSYVECGLGRSCIDLNVLGAIGNDLAGKSFGIKPKDGMAGGDPHVKVRRSRQRWLQWSTCFA